MARGSRDQGAEPGESGGSGAYPAPRSPKPYTPYLAPRAPCSYAPCSIPRAPCSYAPCSIPRAPRSASHGHSVRCHIPAATYLLMHLESLMELASPGTDMVHSFGTIGHYYRQAIGMIIGSHQVIRSCFGSNNNYFPIYLSPITHPQWPLGEISLKSPDLPNLGNISPCFKYIF